MSKSVLTVCLFMVSLGATASTIEECTKHLPEGHEYQIEIVLDVDKTGLEPTVKGSFDVTGGSDSQESSDINDFVECAAPLIKSVDVETNKV